MKAIAFTPTGRSPDSDLAYVERASERRGLCAVMQDLAPRTTDARQHFLREAFRRVVEGFHSATHPETPVAFLRSVVRILDDSAARLDTRVDDFRGLGVSILVRDGDTLYLLGNRDVPARVRVDGLVIPLSANLSGVRELPLETARSQHDLFAQSAPDSLVLYRIDAAAVATGAVVEVLLGGLDDDVASVLDVLDVGRDPSVGTVGVERCTHTVLYATFGARAPAVAETRARPRPASRAGRRVLPVAIGAIAVLAVVAWVVRHPAPVHDGEAGSAAASGASQQSAPPLQERTVDPPGATKVAASDTRDDADGFALAWVKEYSGAVTSSPSPAGGAIVFGSRDGHVYALDRKSGDRLWAYDAAGGVGASPVVQGDAVVTADYAGVVARIASDDGRRSWQRALRERVVSTPAVTDTRIFVGTTKGNVYALSLESGRVLWKFRTRGQIRGSIAVGAGRVFVPSYDGRLYALAEASGEKRWSAKLGGPVGSSPAVADGRVFVGTARGTIEALDAASGARRWSLSTPGAVNSAVAVADGRVFAGGGDHAVYCLDAASGRLVWKFATGATVLSRPEVDGNRVVITSYDGNVYCVGAGDGKSITRYATDHAIFSSPVVVDGCVYFGNNGGRLYCLDVPR